MFARTIAKLDELLELLRDTKRELSPTESKRLQQELAEIRARLLLDSSFKRPSRRRKHDYSTNIAAPAPNMTTIVIPITIRDNHELGRFCMSLRSDAAMRMPTSKNGASEPLMIAVQKSALIGYPDKIHADAR